MFVFLVFPGDFQRSSVTILDVEIPSKAKILKCIPLEKQYIVCHKSFLIEQQEVDNCIKILLFDGVRSQGTFCNSFCELSINFSTMNHSINDEPDIQKHLTAANNAYDEKIITDDCCKFESFIWCQKRYLILFGQMKFADNKELRDIICYDAKRGVWNKCRYQTPFAVNLARVILAKHSKNGNYLHFIFENKHIQLAFDTNEQLWNVERLIWIGYLKMQNNNNAEHAQSELMMKTRNICLFGSLPQDIIKYILLFLRTHPFLYFAQLN